ncbi:MAG: hypothetical protein KF708_24480, partial [Pirellulales bacterium]|nr:hypothetical protein [Pirellulales bacterium]
PIPTVEQVGPRSLLQYGKLSGNGLASLLFWRKWFYDIDNRAGQETGYLFEPIIASAIGGTPAPASKSPVKRFSNRAKGRQVDCILDKRAYEFKIRVTIAASGQGRWQEELDFPRDCRTSRFTPVLVCIDSTPNPKLTALAAAFRHQKGEVYIGDAAWKHLDDVAGPTMSIFLDKYVRRPLQDVLAESRHGLADITASWTERAIVIKVGKDQLLVDRHPVAPDDASDPIPDDAVDET